MARWNEKGKARRKPARFKAPRGTVEVTCSVEGCNKKWTRRKATEKPLCDNHK